MVTFTLVFEFAIVPVMPVTLIAEGYGDAVAGSGDAGIVIGVVFENTASADLWARVSETDAEIKAIKYKHL